MSRFLGGYNLLYSKKAAREIRKLDPVARTKLSKALLELSKDPFVSSKKLVSSRLGTYRFRVGNYRVIFDTDNGNIVVLKVAHRRDVYRH